MSGLCSPFAVPFCLSKPSFANESRRPFNIYNIAVTKMPYKDGIRYYTITKTVLAYCVRAA